MVALALGGCLRAQILPGDDGGAPDGDGSDAAGVDRSDPGTGGAGSGGRGDPGTGGRIGSGGAIGAGGIGTGGGAGGTGVAGAAGNGGAGSGGTIGAGGMTGSGGSGAGGMTGSGGGGSGVLPNLAGQLVINEIMVDTDVVADDFGEWFEIYNPSATTAYDIGGCIIADTANSHAVVGHVVVAPRAFITLAIFGPTMATGFVPTYSYGSTLKFSNDGDLVRLTCAGVLIDLVDYAAFNWASGRALSLDPAHATATDNDLPTSWCSAANVYNAVANVRDYGSPGTANPVCP